MFPHPSSTVTRLGLLFGLFAGVAWGNGPELVTPGTATWVTRQTANGTRTVFTISENTILDWDSLNLGRGSKLVFKFEGGERVLNQLGGTGSHVINGTVKSNGIVGFFSPKADLTVNGSVTAKGVTLATLGSKNFIAGGRDRLKGNSASNFLTVNGKVTATGGDVLIAGERVIIDTKGRIRASEAVRIAAGRDVSVSASGDRRIRENSGEGYVLHLGETKAAGIETVAGREISNQGKIDAGSGRIFMKVGSRGKITNESNGIIVGDSVFEGAYDSDGVVLVPDEADALPTVSEGTLTIPSLTRPGRTAVSSSQTVSYSGPVSATEDAARGTQGAEKNKNSRLAANGNKTAAPLPPALATRGASAGKKPMLQRASFFGTRTAPDQAAGR
jgi:hypothetical protein